MQYALRVSAAKISESTYAIFKIKNYMVTVKVAFWYQEKGQNNWETLVEVVSF